MDSGMLRFFCLPSILAQAADSCGFFAYFTLPCNALMVRTHTVVSILLPTLTSEQEH